MPTIKDIARLFTCAPSDPASLLWWQAYAACRRNRRPNWQINQRRIAICGAVVFVGMMVVVYLR